MKREAFLEAILEEPDDDTHRLVYADWLDDNGDMDRAEFIRVQCAIARLPTWDPGRVPLRRRELDLLREHHARWREELPKWAQGECLFRRGFITEITAMTREFLRRGAGLFRRTPLEGMVLRSGTEEAEQLPRSPLLARLRGLRLEIGGASSPEQMRALAGSPHARGLRWLSLFLTEIGPRAGEVLGSSEHLANLKSLVLHGWGGIQDAGARALAESPHLGGLTELRINNCGITGRGAQALTASPGMARLTRLALTANAVDAEGATRLDLSRNRQLGDAGAEALAGCPALASVRELRLVECGIGPAGVRALARSPHLRELRHLDLDHNPVGRAGASALARSSRLESLQLLAVEAADIRDEEIEALFAELPRVRCLVIPHHGMAPDRWDRLQKRWGSRLRSRQEILLTTFLSLLEYGVTEDLTVMPV